MVPADDEHTDSTEAASNTDKKKREPAHLTSMPCWLMKWWSPLLVAFILFAPSLTFAILWGGQPHWPSSKAMKLCMTITGAGLAFSAWQQRSHDNAVRDDDKLDRERAAAQARAEREEQRGLEETRRLEQIERDEYWKRREQIYQLLGSENPGLRLGAVALLAELADKAAQSEQLNKTEQQQLQRHIIDTLCLQLRHEGLNISTEGKKREHGEIQRVILDVILTRINCNNTKPSEAADWSKGYIRLTDTRFLTPITIQNITTHTTIDLSNSNLEHKLRIYGSKMNHIIWVGTNFHDGVEIGQRD